MIYQNINKTKGGGKKDGSTRLYLVSSPLLFGDKIMKPILFNSEMVRAIQAGRKTQTRRVCKFQDRPIRLKDCPYGKVGDVLWMRESYYINGHSKTNFAISGWYISDKEEFDRRLTVHEQQKFLKWKWKKQFGPKPSIFMFHSLARIFLEITNIRVERVQEISGADCIDEGIVTGTSLNMKLSRTDPKPFHEQRLVLARKEFQNLWDAINTKRSFGWDVNPWVWCIEFKQSESEE